MFNADTITDCLKLDIGQANQIPKIEFKQHSKENRFYHIQIVKKNTPVNITGYAVSVFYKKSNGKTILHQVKPINPKFGICELSITQDLIDEYGIIECELYLKKGATTIVSSQFNIKVNRAVYQADDKPSVDMLLIEEKINKIRREVGSISRLETEERADVVSAINSVKRTLSNVSESKLEIEKTVKKEEIDRMLSFFNIK